LATLEEAFEDNEAPAAPVGVDGDEVAVVVLVPGVDTVPERMPRTTAAGNLSLAKITKGDRAGFYKLMVGGHMLATARETFAVAPGMKSTRIAAIRSSHQDAYGRRRAECILAGRFSRAAFEGVLWEKADAVRIMNGTSTDLVIRQVGQAKDLAPLDLSTEPRLAALIEAVDFNET
jgi:hypothetical protein